MNPSLRLLFFLLLLVAVAAPLAAQGLPVEFQLDEPYPYAIIDDPDPTGRLRLLPRFAPDLRVMLWPAALPAATPAPIVAWARRSASGLDVVVSRYRQDAFGAPIVVAASFADERDPRLAHDPRDGTVHVVYWIDGPLPVVVHRFAPADLSRFSEPEIVSPPGERAARPSASVHDGVLHVAYESLGPDGDAAPRLIVLARRGDSGFTTEVIGATSAPSPGWPQVHSDRSTLWVEWVGDSGTMAWRTVLPGGLGPVGREPFDTTTQDRELARGRIAMRARE